MRFKVTADYLAAVTRKVSRTVLMVVLTLTGYGCNTDRVPPTPFSPSPTVQDGNPAPNPTLQDRNPAGELWRAHYHNRVTGGRCVLLDTACR